MNSGAFTPDTTRELLDEACEATGLDTGGAQLIRMGENAMYRLASGTIMARIGRSVSAARKEARVANWLAAHQFPAERLASVKQPVILDEFAVTFWEFIEEDEKRPTPEELGALLFALHKIPEPSDLSLSFFEPMPKIENRLATVGGFLPREDVTFLDQRREELQLEFGHLKFPLGFGPVHGDCHAGNLMRDQTGLVKLIDFEDFCWGPREWDVCVEAVRYYSFGWVSDEDYAEYTSAYGFDPLRWSGFPVVKAIRELNMTTWLAQQLGQSAEVDEEVHKRISDLRDSQAPRNWRPF